MNCVTFIFSFHLTDELKYPPPKNTIKVFQIANREVCFYSYLDCCYIKIPIQVKNCQTFMVYRLNSTARPFVCARYCTIEKGIIDIIMNKIKGKVY